MEPTHVAKGYSDACNRRVPEAITASNREMFWSLYETMVTQAS